VTSANTKTITRLQLVIVGLMGLFLSSFVLQALVVCVSGILHSLP